MFGMYFANLSASCMSTQGGREKVSRDKMGARRAKRDGLRKGGLGLLPLKCSKPVLQMVQSEVFLSYICA